MSRDALQLMAPRLQHTAAGENRCPKRGCISFIRQERGNRCYESATFSRFSAMRSSCSTSSRFWVIVLSRAFNRSLSARTSSMGISSEYSAFRSEEHTSELQSRGHIVCRLLLEKKKK